MNTFIIHFILYSFLLFFYHVDIICLILYLLNNQHVVCVINVTVYFDWILCAHLLMDPLRETGEAVVTVRVI